MEKQPSSATYAWIAEEEVFRHGGIFVTMGAALLLALSFETLPLPIKAQVMPLASLLALIFFPFVVRNLPKTPLFTVVVLFTLYAAAHSSIGLFVDMIRGEPAVRFVAWARQIMALAAGCSLFLVLRKVLSHLSDRQIVRYIVIGAVPALVLAILNILWGALQQNWAGNIVIAVRSTITPAGRISPFRASGLALEPSTFAASLAIVMFPILLALFGSKISKGRAVVLLILTLAAFGWTFSSTGLVILFPMLLAGLVFGPKRKFILKMGMLFSLIVIAVLVLFPSNQILRHARSLAAGQANISFIDRFYSTVGPFMTSFSSFNMLGYGLGGTASHFSEILPETVQKEIASVKWKELPNLSTLIGRIFAEIGALGFVFFLLMIGVTFWELRKLLQKNLPAASRLFLASARLGLIGALVGVTFAFGSFHIPFFWLWIAVIDSRYFLLEEK